MQLKKIWISVVFVLTLLPVVAHAQNSMFGLKSGKFGGGVDIRGSADSDVYVLTGNLGFGFNNGNSKLAVLGGVPTDDLGVPTYIIGVDGLHIYPLESGFEILSIAEFSFVVVEDAVTIPTTFIGGLGVAKPLEAGTGTAKPFASLLYQRLEAVVGGETVTLFSGFGAGAGLEYKMSGFSIIAHARSGLPINTSEVAFRVGINFFF